MRLDVAYDGTDFSGWAVQPGRRTVQGELSAALQRVLPAVQLPITVAGRTDAGVHATGQVTHADVGGWPGDAAMLRRLNAVLPADVRVHAAAVAPEGFDARFSVAHRRYEYLIDDHIPDPRRRRYVLAHRGTLDVPAMTAAGRNLLGEHDFAAFCKQRVGASTVRTLQQLEVSRTDVISVQVQADAFCHSMVRALVGGLLAVGVGRIDSIRLRAILDNGRREPVITVAPAHGLTLVAVAYPDDVADQATRSRRVRGRMS